MESLYPTPDALCRFCTLHQGSSTERKHNTVLVDDGNFFVVPSLGSIVPGWLLVVSHDHYLCAGALGERDRFLLFNMAVSAKDKVQKAFGAVSIFEHGPSRPSTPVGCGIDHLHLHLAPLQQSLTKACSEIFGTEWKSISDLSDLEVLYRGGQDYMLVQEPEAEWRWAKPPVGVRQPLRRAIAHMNSVPDSFDYRLHQFNDNVALTLRQVTHTP